jgi:ATP-dependent 26S proteasome regulatory subunit
MTLSSINIDSAIPWDTIADNLVGNSYAKIDLIAQNAAKFCVLDNTNIVSNLHIQKAIEEITFKF